MAKFFRYPFAVSGTKTAVPEATDPSGAVSYQEGWGPDYELAQGVDPDAKDIPRPESNQLMYDVTNALRQYQTMGYPDFITTSDNGGSPFSYSINAYVRYDAGSGFEIYYSLADSNTALPTDTTKWAKVQPPSPVPTGVVWELESSVVPTGWLLADGKTVGNAASNATGRANADTLALFTVIWNTYTNAIRPILTSAGAASTRGISAAADFAANKALPISDRRGRVAAGVDNMGGTAAGLLTTPQLAGDTIGATGGLQTHTLSTSELAAHSHGASGITVDSAGAHVHSGVPTRTNNGGGLETYANGGGAGTVDTGTAGIHTHTLSGNTSNAGGGTAHNNVQPTIVCNFIIKL